MGNHVLCKSSVCSFLKLNNCLLYFYGKYPKVKGCYDIYPTNLTSPITLSITRHIKILSLSAPLFSLSSATKNTSI
ncbi:hypothetical protein L1887_21246 [Cichorium endivia]|nr:hypothetical protein L1887_21246 [Cichorium endivia]